MGWQVRNLFEAYLDQMHDVEIVSTGTVFD